MNKSHTESNFISVEEAVEKFKLTRSYIYRLCRIGKIGCKPAQSMMVDAASLEQHISSAKRGRPRKDD